MPSEASQSLFIGADHAGFALKERLAELIRSEFPSLKLSDLGCMNEESVHYPDYAEKVARKVAASSGLGILVCGSGIGMAISANKVKGVRAASAWDVTSARLCREHNDANIVCIGARLTGQEVAFEIVRTFLKSQFLGGRHTSRVDLIRKLEGEKA